MHDKGREAETVKEVQREASKAGTSAKLPLQQDSLDSRGDMRDLVRNLITGIMFLWPFNPGSHLSKNDTSVLQ